MRLALLVSLSASLLVSPLAANIAPARVSLPSRAEKKTLAVIAFDNNTGKSDYDHLGKGISTMMTNDLASVDDIQVVERDRLADVLAEIKLQQSTSFDSTTAVKVGKLVGAEYIVTGAFVSADPQMRIDTRIIRVQSGVIVKTASVTGKGDRFLELEKQLSRQLIRDLNVTLTPEGEAKLDRRQANGITNVEDANRMANAIDLSDRGDYAEAAVKIAPLVAKYPNSAMLKLTSDEIKKRAAKSSKQKAKDKINETVGGLIKKKWPPR